MSKEPLNRRTFIRNTAAAGLALPFSAAPLSAAASDTGHSAGGPTRIKGRVQALDAPLKGVAVTDGSKVVQTDGAGNFELVSDGQAKFVYITIPSGYQIPVSSSGTAHFFRTILPDSNGEATVLFELIPLPIDDSSHSFFLLADPQTETLEETGMLHAHTVPDLQNEADRRLSEHLFGITCGDIMFDHLELYPEYERAVARLGIPFFQVVGNHDLNQDVATNGLSTRTYQEHFGPQHYSFNRGAAHYVVLNDVFWYGTGYIGYLNDQQLAWLEQDLALVEPGSLVVVCVHIPTQSTVTDRLGNGRDTLSLSVANRDALYRLLAPFKAHILSGHTHEIEHVWNGNIREHVNGAVCGAWWSGPICFDGTPNGYGIYQVRGEELRWQYKATGQPVEQQMRLYYWGAEPQAPDEIVANVWNADPEWKVVYYEDGALKGPMARRRGVDPLSVKLHTGPNLPPRRPWVEPRMNNHMFYAPASRSASKIRVEATDPFGRVYVEELRSR